MIAAMNGNWEERLLRFVTASCGAMKVITERKNDDVLISSAKDESAVARTS